MDTFVFVLIGFGILLIIDFLTIATRSGLREASFARLLQLQDQGENKAQEALALMGKLPRPYAGLHLLQSLVHFLLFGGLLLFIYQATENLGLWAIIGIMLLVGFIVALAEWGFERLVLRNPENWVIRLIPFIRAVNLLFYPLSSLALLWSGDSRNTDESPGKVTEDELITLVDAGPKNSRR